MKQYKVTYEENGIIKNIIIDSNSFKNTRLPKCVISIKPIARSSFPRDLFKNNKIKDKELNALFYELNLMLESNIVFSDALDILIKNRKEKNILELLSTIKASLVNAKPMSETLKDFQINYLVGSFFQIAQQRGDINSNIKALSKLLHETSAIKKEFLKAIKYPIVLVITFFLSLLSMFFFVVPKFKTIFAKSYDSLPTATKVLFFIQEFFENYMVYVFIFLGFVIALIFYTYKNSKEFEFYIHKSIVKNIPIIKDIYVNMQLYKIFLVLEIMLNSKYEFHKAVLASRVLLKNKYLLDRITLIDNLLQSGKSINYAFSKTGIFDDMILNLLNTAEITNTLDTTVVKIKDIYKNRFNDKIKLLISFIEPFFIITIMGLILWIVLAVLMPIWDMSNMLKV